MPMKCILCGRAVHGKLDYHKRCVEVFESTIGLPFKEIMEDKLRAQAQQRRLTGEQPMPVLAVFEMVGFIKKKRKRRRKRGKKKKAKKKR